MAETQNKLPISVDVSISLSKAQVATGTDMTIICFCTPSVDFLHGDRVKIYSTSDAFNKICTPGDSVYWAGNAFFSKTNRPSRIAVGKVFSANQPAYILSGGCDPELLKEISDGSFEITVDGSAKTVTGIDFSGVETTSDVADLINTKITAWGTCSTYNDNIIIKTTTTGDNAKISLARPTTGGTDVSDLLGLTLAKGAGAFDGYTAGTISQEMQKIADAGARAGLFFYGWTIDSSYRDTTDQAEAMRWVNGRSFRACGAFATNNPTAISTTDTTNNGYKAMNEGLNADNFTYSDNGQTYPEISYLANFLAVNYNLANSTIAGKFKDADGIAAVNFPDIETNVETLKSKRINTITGIIGQNVKYFRDGVQSGGAWSTDAWVNASNFISELEIEILNVFLRAKKVPYTQDGQNLLIAAATKICNKYKNNGSYADRVVEDQTSEQGFKIIPACQVEIQELSAVTAAQRADHIGTPIAITLQDSGWMGSIAINIEVVG